MPRYFLTIYFLSFVGGVFLGSVVDLGNTFPALVIFVGIVIGVALFAFGGVERGTLFCVFLSFVLFAFGVWHIERATKHAFFLETKIREKIELNGIVRSEPERKEKYARFIVCEKSGGENVLIYAEPFSAIRYGDEVKLTGMLRRPENFSSGTETEVFDWQSYLAHRDIFYEMFYPEISVTGVSHRVSDRFRRLLFHLKNSFTENLRAVIPEPEASLLAGEVVGEKSSLGEELAGDLRRTGLTHIVVLSGYNITVISENLIKMLVRVPYISQGAAFSVGFTAIFLFVLMTGASEAAVRAAIMTALMILARRYGRLYQGGTALFLAAGLMILFEPRLLLFNAAFQLSFAATAGLLYLSPIFEKKLMFIPKRFGLREIFSATLGAQVAVLPFLIYLTGEVSLVSPLTNVLVVPVVSHTMFFGFLVGISGFISYGVSYLFGLCATLLLAYQIFIVNLFSAIPFSVVKFNKLVFILSIIILIFVFFNTRTRRTFQKKEKPPHGGG